MPRLLTPACPPEAAPGIWVTDPAVLQAARQLAGGGLVGLPTETVYGLAADAGRAEAVHRIFEAKGRPADHPLIVHLPPRWSSGVAHHARDVPEWALALMEAFWPGPLTLILPRRSGIATAAAGGQDSVGLRCPAHPAAQAVLQAAQALGVQGVAAPSANRFGRVSPTTAAHVMDEFKALPDAALAVLDGGACAVGIESTIVDASRGRPVLLRPGMLTPAQLEAVCGQPVLSPQEAALDSPAPRASGTLASHYAPTARVRLMSAGELVTAVDVLSSAGSGGAHPGAAGVGIYSRGRPGTPGALASGRCIWRRMPAEAWACAHELFAVLRELDAQGVQLIWVETPPPGAEWDGVRDRLARAAA